MNQFANAQQQALDRSAAANERYAEALEDSGRATEQAIEDANRNFRKASEKSTEKFNEGLLKDIDSGFDNILKIGQDFAKDAKQNELEFQRELRDIRRGAKDDALDALDDRNVLELLEINKTRKRAIRDAKIAKKDEASDAKLAKDDRLKEEQDAQVELRQDRLEAFRDQRDDLRESLDEQEENIARAESRREDRLLRSKNKELAILEKGLAEQQRAWQEFVKEFLRAGGQLNELIGDVRAGSNRQQRELIDNAFVNSSLLALDR